MRQRLKVCLVGLGNIGRAHMEIYSNLSKLVDLYCVDINPAQIPTNVGIGYDSLEQAIEQNNFDLIDICTPTDLHFLDIKLAFEATSAAILVEKPFVRTEEELRYVVKLCTNYPERIIMCAMVERFFEPFIQLKKWTSLQSTPLDFNFIRRTRRPTNWMLNSRRSGGVCFDLGIHDIDLFQWLSSDKIDKIVLLNASDNEVNLKLSSQKGHTAKMFFAWNIDNKDPVSVVNRLEINTTNKKVIFTSDDNILEIESAKMHIERPRFPFAYRDEIKNVLRAIMLKSQPAITLHEIIDTMNSMFCINKLLMEGKK